MRFPLAPTVVLFAGGVGLSVSAIAASAQPPAGPALPLREVTLFSSGVGFYHRSAEIRTDTTLSLSFRAEQINDILKSMVLLDPAGAVQPVTYAAQDAPGGRLRGANRELGASISLGDLLRQFQGAQVRLNASEPVEGRLISVSRKSVQAGKEAEAFKTDVANLFTPTGLRAVPLDDVRAIELLDARLNQELKESLERLASDLDDTRRSVEVRFSGNRTREVRIGYLQEAPIWKTSYRLVLDQDRKPYLQGWAIVDNTTDEDWQGVRLSLVSGRPISFLQDLYQPLYVPRPVVRTQLAGNPTPQAYQDGIALVPDGISGVLGFPTDNSLLIPAERRVNVRFQGTRLREALRQLFEGSGLRHAVDPSVPDIPITANLQNQTLTSALRALIRLAAERIPGLTTAREGDVYIIRIRFPVDPNAQMTQEEQPSEADLGERASQRRARIGLSAQGLARSVTSDSTGTAKGDLFEYAIRQPVTLPRGRAAMVPIVTTEVEGEQISIFDTAVDALPLLGFRLRNSTGLHLAGGPITVLRDGTYAGDAQMTSLQPRDSRLLSYAVDPDLTVTSEPDSTKQELATVTATGGLLTVVRKERQVQVYQLRNKGARPRVLWLQHTVSTQHQILEPAPEERSGDRFRFRSTVPANGNLRLRIVSERPLETRYSLVDADPEQLLVLAKEGKLSEALKAGLADVVSRRRRVTELQAQVAALQTEIRTIGEEQSRIRMNMAQLDRTSALYQQYVRKLTDQETRIEKVRGEVARLNDSIVRAREELRAAIGTLKS
jgi:hypothetical protein